ncbi:hypothetical protein M758_5G154700 [Ceratodon purpureus]|nr:hypothetical protein M758_5G154700 [Ceratodon purpureus]
MSHDPWENNQMVQRVRQKTKRSSLRLPRPACPLSTSSHVGLPPLHLQYCRRTHHQCVHSLQARLSCLLVRPSLPMPTSLAIPILLHLRLNPLLHQIDTV